MFLLNNSREIRLCGNDERKPAWQLIKERFPYNVSNNTVIKTIFLYDYKINFFLLMVPGLEIVKKVDLEDRNCVNDV